MPEYLFGFTEGFPFPLWVFATGLLFSAWLHAVLHEMGHFAVRVLLGDPPRIVRVGYPGFGIAFRCRFFPETTFFFGLMPFFGFVGDPENERRLQPTPLRQVAVSIGGLGTSLLLTLASTFVVSIAGRADSVFVLGAALCGGWGVTLLAVNSFGDNTDGARLLFALRHIIKGGQRPSEYPLVAKRNSSPATIACRAITGGPARVLLGSVAFCLYLYLVFFKRFA